MELIDTKEIKDLNLLLFQEKLYFHLELEDEVTGSIQLQGGCEEDAKRESACEKIRDFFMERGLWTMFSGDLGRFQLEKMESEF